jgi:hypothetical protein
MIYSKVRPKNYVILFFYLLATLFLLLLVFKIFAGQDNYGKNIKYLLGLITVLVILISFKVKSLKSLIFFDEYLLIGSLLKYFKTKKKWSNVQKIEILNNEQSKQECNRFAIIKFQDYELEISEKSYSNFEEILNIFLQKVPSNLVSKIDSSFQTPEKNTILNSIRGIQWIIILIFMIVFIVLGIINKR